MKNFTAIIIALAIGTAAANSDAQIEVDTSGGSPEFISSVNCAKCHLDIYNYWKGSLHAHAFDDYVFQAAFMLALKEEGDEVREVCLDCHVPTTLTTEDYMLEQPISSESITCDFCHRISDLKIDKKNNSVHLTAGDEKYGPLESRKATEKAHPSVQSAVFTDSKFCATCHQWTNSQGIAIFDTYREWSNGPFAEEGTHCQQCHMPLVQGALVSSKPKGPAEKINSHNLAGGHSITQVASASKVKIASFSRVPAGIHVVVEVSNVGSGHMIPTGIPSRSLVLEVQLLDSEGVAVETDTYTFRRVILDSEHNELTNDADIILKGALVSKDNRIPPGGQVEIPFDFAASPRKKYSVRATLRYIYRPLVLKEEEINIQMGSDSDSL